MASILENLKRRIRPYGNTGALGAFRMPEGYSGRIPGAVSEAADAANKGGVSKAVSRAGEWVLSILSARGQSKTFSELPAAKVVQAAPAAGTAGAAVRPGSPVNHWLQGGERLETISMQAKNLLTSNVTLQAVNAAAAGISGSRDGRAAALLQVAGPSAAIAQAPMQSGAAQAASVGFDAVSGDGSAYRDWTAVSSGEKGGSAVVQVEMVNHNAVSAELDLDRVVNYLSEKVAEGLQTAAEAVHW